MVAKKQRTMVVQQIEQTKQALPLSVLEAVLAAKFSISSFLPKSLMNKARIFHQTKWKGVESIARNFSLFPLPSVILTNSFDCFFGH